MTAWTVAENKRLSEEKARLEAEARIERERLEALAISAVKEGNRDEAEALLNSRASVVASKVYDNAKVSGFHTRTQWKARVVNKALVPEAYKIVDMVALNKLASAGKGAFSVEGVEFFQEVIGVSK
jgi:hypothetical protein